MKLTIVVYDKAVIVDGIGYTGFDLSSLSETVRAVQWDGTNGWIEEVINGVYVNTPLESIDQYQSIIAQWNIVHAEQTAPVPDAPITYVQQRLRAYPSWGDQLDMLWHAIDNGTLDKNCDFYTSIKAVKDQFPKP